MVPDIFNYSQIISVDFGVNYLVGPLPPSLWGLTTVVYLEVNKNFLTGMSYDAIVCMLCSLVMMCIRCAGTLSSAIGNLVKLLAVDVSSNAFSGKSYT